MNKRVNKLLLPAIMLPIVFSITGGFNAAYAGETISTDDLKEAAGTSSGSGSEQLYFQWTTDEDGNIKFENNGGETNADYTYSYNNNQYVNKSKSNSGYGAALNNDNGILDDISDDFVNNFLDNTQNDCKGGGIWNPGTINSLSGNFIGNYIISTAAGEGGAIANVRDTGFIGSITGKFIGNHINAGNIAYGGAIQNYNGASIGVIASEFIGNYVIGTSSAHGGAIDNSGSNAVIESIENSVFLGNYAKSDSGEAQGGAINNQSTISEITNSSFTGNYAKSSADYALAGAIYNEGTIGDINAYFTNNYTDSSIDAYGGAIYNENGGTIGGIMGAFTGNYVSGSTYAYGGAIYNDGIINDVTGDFINNYAQSSYTSSDYIGAAGGAIFNNNNGTINNITGNFIGSYASGLNDVRGGAIFNNGTINDITGSFINSRVQSESGYAYGGAVYNYFGTINDITGNFINNYVSGSSDSGDGGAIYNLYGTINSITGYFEGNNVIVDGMASGGAVNNNTSAIITEGITANFKDNYVKSTGVENLARGGAILNFGSVKQITGDFEGNYAESAGTGAIGGAIANMYTDDENTIGIIDSISGSFIGNYAYAEEEGIAQGGAIYNEGTIGTTDDDGNVTGGGIINSSFYNNYAKSESGEAQGGAIYTNGTLVITSDGGTTEFTGNYTDSAGTIDDNAIYVGSSDAAVNFELKNNGIVIMNDNIRGEEGYKVNIQGDSIDNTTFYMFNDMYNANLSAGNTAINTVNNDIHVYDLSSFTLTNSINMAVDVDLANETMDRFTASSYGEHQGTLTVTNMNLLSDTNKDSVAILFAETGLKDNVANNSLELPDGYQTTAYTPIYKYNVSYDNRNDGGYFVFDKDSVNPAVMTGAVASQVGGYLTQSEVLQQSFYHMGRYTKYTRDQRFAAENNNRYASSEGGIYTLSPLPETSKALWMNPYTSFERVNLKGGIGVDNITYGTLVGGDSDLYELKNGYKGVISTFVGYNGSHQSYSGNSIYQNGGTLGLTGTLYKGNFFTGLTAAAGASAGQADTMYGTDNFTMLTAGVASKTGYNFEFKEGRYIVQPSLYLGYTFVNTFDYTNAAGVSINSDPLHALQVIPGVTFIGNLKNGWQPYASVQMVWNAMDHTHFTANEVTLPQLSVKPYVQYGVGVQKTWADKFTGFLQAMIRNGGRSGVGLQAGFRWALGKEPEHKIQAAGKTPELKKTVIKLNNIK